MGLFRQAAIDAQQHTFIGNQLIPPSRHLTVLVWSCCILFGLLTTWVLTRQYEQTKAIQGITQYTQGEFSIISPHQGIIQSIHISPNQTVEAGQALFTINMQTSSGFTEADIQTQQAQYNTIQAHLVNKQTNIEISFRAQKRYLEESSNNTQRVINNLSEQVSLLNSDYVAQNTQRKRMLSLYEKGVVSAPQIEQQHTQLRAIKSRILQLEQSLIEHESQLELFLKQLVDLAANKEEQLANIETRLVQNLTKLQALEFQTSAIITAPKDGIVTQLMLKEGGTIRSQDRLGVLVPLGGELVGRLLIPSIANADIRRHQAVHLQMAAYPHTLYGQLTTAITHVDTPTFQTNSTGMHALVTLPNVWRSAFRGKDINLTSGMEFTALIVIEQYPLWQKLWLKLTNNFTTKGAKHA